MQKMNTDNHPKDLHNHRNCIQREREGRIEIRISLMVDTCLERNYLVEIVIEGNLHSDQILGKDNLEEDMDIVLEKKEI